MPAKFHAGLWRDSGRRLAVLCALSAVVVHCGRTEDQLPVRRRIHAVCWDSKTHWDPHACNNGRCSQFPINKPFYLGCEE